MRAVSVLFVVIHVYWFCYGTMREWGLTIGTVDRMLLNFQRTAALFDGMLKTKLFAVVFLALSCLGTRGVKNDKITWERIWLCLGAGAALFFLNWWILSLPVMAGYGSGIGGSAYAGIDMTVATTHKAAAAGNIVAGTGIGNSVTGSHASVACIPCSASIGLGTDGNPATALAADNCSRNGYRQQCYLQPCLCRPRYQLGFYWFGFGRRQPDSSCRYGQ
jgi:hypothetical protein